MVEGVFKKYALICLASFYLATSLANGVITRDLLVDKQKSRAEIEEIFNSLNEPNLIPKSLDLIFNSRPQKWARNLIYYLHEK